MCVCGQGGCTLASCGVQSNSDQSLAVNKLTSHCYGPEKLSYIACHAATTHIKTYRRVCIYVWLAMYSYYKVMNVTRPL